MNDGYDPEKLATQERMTIWRVSTLRRVEIHMTHWKAMLILMSQEYGLLKKALEKGGTAPHKGQGMVPCLEELLKTISSAFTLDYFPQFYNLAKTMVLYYLIHQTHILVHFLERYENNIIPMDGHGCGRLYIVSYYLHSLPLRRCDSLSQSWPLSIAPLPLEGFGLVSNCFDQ